MSTVGLRRRIDRLESARRSIAPEPETPEQAAAKAELQRWMDLVQEFDEEDMRTNRFPRSSMMAYELAGQFDGVRQPVQTAEDAWEEFRGLGYLEAARLLWDRLGPLWPEEWPEPPAVSSASEQHRR